MKEHDRSATQHHVNYHVDCATNILLSTPKNNFLFLKLIYVHAFHMLFHIF